MLIFLFSYLWFTDLIITLGPKKKIYNFTIDNSWKNEIFIFGQILNRKIKEQNSIDDAIDVMKVIEKIYSNDKSWVTKVKKYNEKSIQKK